MSDIYNFDDAKKHFRRQLNKRSSFRDQVVYLLVVIVQLILFHHFHSDNALDSKVFHSNLD